MTHKAHLIPNEYYVNKFGICVPRFCLEFNADINLCNSNNKVANARKLKLKIELFSDNTYNAIVVLIQYHV